MTLSKIPLSLWRWAFWGCVAAVLVLALSPGTEKLPSTGWDKSNHLISFVTMALLGLQAYARQGVRLFIGLVLFGGLIEVLQSLTSYRFAEWGDWLADTLGLVLSYAVHGLWRLKISTTRRV